MRGLDGASDWYMYEMYVWELGERVRTVSRSALGPRGLRPTPEAIEQFVALKPIGKGRRCRAAFALDVGRADSATRLATHLGDDELDGIVLKGLSAYRVSGHADIAAN